VIRATSARTRATPGKERRWPIRDTIILTVFNRPELVLLNTLISVTKQDLADTEVLIIDDGSTVDYTDVREMLDEWKLPYRWERIATLEHRPHTYNINGYNSPAYVNNRAASMADGDNLFFLSSDTIIPPNTMGSARVWDLDKAVYTTRVVDMDSGVEWHGSSRIYPLYWFVGMSKALFNRIGGFDEEYLKGMAFDGADFSGRAALDTRKLVIDCGTLALHQTHELVAHSDGGAGFKASMAYTKKKWGGQTPWSSAEAPLNYTTSKAGDKIIVKPRPTELTLAALRAA
jgi:glycosyltransferase involved in cell wall biosynthesis